MRDDRVLRTALGFGLRRLGGRVAVEQVRADDELLTCEPARELPMAQRYFLF